MIELWGIVTASTLLLTRSSLSKEFIHARCHGRLLDLLTCPICSGFWIAIIVGLCLGSTLGQMAAAYVLAVLAITFYDAAHYYAWDSNS